MGQSWRVFTQSRRFHWRASDYWKHAAVNFGQIENLAVRAGEPTFDPAPRITEDIKIGSKNGPRCELSRDDFALKSQVTEMFDHLSRFGDGFIASIEVKHGLPFRLVIERQPGGAGGFSTCF